MIEIGVCMRKKVQSQGKTQETQPLSVLTAISFLYFLTLAL